MSTQANDEELTPAGLRRNRLTLAYREGQKAGRHFQRLLHDTTPGLTSEEWTHELFRLRLAPIRFTGESRTAWTSGFANGRHAERAGGELSPSPYEDVAGRRADR